MYDGLGRVVGHSSNGFATSYAYTPMGTLGTRSVTSGTISVSGSYSYEETDEADEEIHPLTGRISGYTTTVKNGSTVKSSTDYTYTYDGAGNITEIRENGELKYKYTYDNLGQLIREDNAAAGKSFTYEFDKGGNLTTKKTYAYTTGTLGNAQKTVVYQYDGNKRISSPGVSLLYDEFGNPTRYANEGQLYTLTWDRGNKVTAVSGSNGTVTYSYNAAMIGWVTRIIGKLL